VSRDWAVPHDIDESPASTRYGDIASAVRVALAERGIVESHDLKLVGTNHDSITTALNREAKLGRAVRLFRGVYATPEVAARVKAAIEAKP